jgi:hypothetical protein
VFSYIQSYKIPLGDNFRLCTSHHQAFSFKDHSIKLHYCSQERNLFLYKVRHRNILKRY